MKLEIVRRIACERNSSSLVRAEPQNAVQGLRLKKLYELLIVLRIILTLNLQTGWVHQDEFTNSLEVITGINNTLNPNCYRSSFVLVSIVLHHPSW